MMCLILGAEQVCRKPALFLNISEIQSRSQLCGIFRALGPRSGKKLGLLHKQTNTSAIYIRAIGIDDKYTVRSKYLNDRMY
jgi:hypothetical protein